MGALLPALAGPDRPDRTEAYAGTATAAKIIIDFGQEWPAHAGAETDRLLRTRIVT
ncbi:hypothetical protein EKH55_5498 [Sinorhizobium alkalisoli]|nr:hypothetical protein EKH55_5498 [Sinorhizobium alkalisoli]